jgi:hypothetical protein
MSDETAEPIVEAAEKRRRGRPSGSYGSYRPRQANELNAPAELNSELNQAAELNPPLNADAASPGLEVRSTWKPRKKKGAGTGKPAPEVVFNGLNIFGDDPPKQREVFEYSEEMADRICKWLATGRSLRIFCFQDDTPSASRVSNWLAARPEFYERYARAKIEGMDRLAEWAVDELADKNLPPEQVQRAKAAFEARKWYVSKIAPLRYGDKLQVNQEISGPGGGPLQVDVLVNMLLTQANMERLTDLEVESIRSAALKLAAPAAPIVEGEFSEVPPSGEPAED